MTEFSNLDICCGKPQFLKRTIFFFIIVFSIQLTVKMSNINFDNEWIRTTDLWCGRRPLYQLSHNHCPNSFFLSLSSSLSFFSLSLFFSTQLNTAQRSRHPFSNSFTAAAQVEIVCQFLFPLVLCF